MKAEWTKVIAAGILVVAIIVTVIYVVESTKYKIVPASTQNYSAAYVMNKRTGITDFYILQKKIYSIDPKPFFDPEDVIK